MTFRMLSAAIGAVSVVALTAGCAAGGGSDDGHDAPTDTLRVTLEIPATFDPALGMSMPDFMLARNSFDTLIRSEAGSFIPGLATEWEASLTSAEFVIRDDATCSDGTPITPTVIADSLTRTSESGAPTVGEIFGNQTPSISVNDADGTLRIEVESPWPDLLAGLAKSSAGIVCPAGLADLEGLAAGTVEGAESGPYVLESFDPGVRYSYTLREDYDVWPNWSDVQGHPAQNLEFVVTPDPAAAANLVLDGQLDIAKIQHESTDRFSDTERFDISTFLYSDMYLLFNERESSPFSDMSLRRAVVQALDREEFRNVVMGDFGELLPTFSSANARCVTGPSSALIPYDVDAAKPLLEGVTIRLVGPQLVGTNGAGLVYMQEALRAAGADVVLTNVDVGTWISTVFAEPGAWDLTVFADLNALGTLASPIEGFVGDATEDGGGNIGATQAPEAAAAFGEARNATDEEEYCAKINEAADHLIEGAHGAPMITGEFIYVQRDGFFATMPAGTLDDHIFRILE